jgi:hypothetical protein
MLHSRIRWEPLAAKQDRRGKRWNFSYWHTVLSPIKAQRLFFWDDEFKECGVILFHGGSTRPYSQIRNLVDKLVADQRLRTQHRRELRFPLERHYAEFGAFPEEAQGSSM